MRTFLRRHGYKLLLIIGLILIADTVLLLFKTASRTLGIFMPAVIGAPLVIVAAMIRFIPEFFVSLFGKLLKWLLIMGYSCFAIIFLCTTVLTFTEGHKTPPNDADILIVPGCGVKGSRVTLTLSNRLDRAIEYLEENENTVVIVSGGQGRGEDISEAQAMHDYMCARGIEDERIIMEDKSESTEENFKFSKKIADKLYPNGAKVCYVTTYFHVYRAGKVAQSCGFEDISGMGAKGVWYITPNDYLRECVAICVYFVTGRL